MGEDFRLKWNDHHVTFFNMAEQLCLGDRLTDVTLSCDSKEFSAHKLILSIFSGYFSQLFTPRVQADVMRRPADSAAIVYLRDIQPRHMELILNYMYRGEISVEESDLMSFLDTAKSLQIKGLTEVEDPKQAVTNPAKTAKKRMVPKESTKKVSAPPPAKVIKRETTAPTTTSPESIEVAPSHDELGPFPGENSDTDHAGVADQDNDGNDDHLDSTAHVEDQSNSTMRGKGSTSSAKLVVLCPVCHKGFPSRWKLERHQKSRNCTEETAKPKICFACNKEFPTKWKLERHERSHTGEKPFSCPICQERHVTKDLVKKHCQAKHIMSSKTYYDEVFPLL